MTRTQLWRFSSETFSTSGMRANSSCHDGCARSAGRRPAGQDESRDTEAIHCQNESWASRSWTCPSQRAR